MSGFLAFVSDMHIAPESAGADRAQSDLDRPARRRARLTTALAHIRRLGPTAVFFGGDNANQPVDRPAYRETLQAFTDKTPCPWHAIPGNHDIGSTVGWHHHDPTHMAEARGVFRKTFGPDWWACEAEGFRILGVNSQIFGSELPAAAKQSHWLKENLAKPSEMLTTVYLHTPPYLQSPADRFEDGSEQMCLRPAAREPLLAILDSTPPDLLISAHVHRFWKRREPAWDWLGLPATALGLDEMAAVPDHNVPEGDNRVGWVALRREGEGWHAEFHPIA